MDGHNYACCECGGGRVWSFLVCHYHAATHWAALGGRLLRADWERPRETVSSISAVEEAPQWAKWFQWRPD